MATSNTTSALKRIQILKDFFCITQAWNPSTTFSHMLNVSATKILQEMQNDKNSFVYCEKKKLLTYRYQIPPHFSNGSALSNATNSQNTGELQNKSIMKEKNSKDQSLFLDVPLSALLALIDNVTTWALVQHPKQNSKGRRPGVSVQLYTEYVHPLFQSLQSKEQNDIFQSSSSSPPVSIQSGDYIDIEVQITKMGRNLGFTKAEIKDSKSGQIICKGRHTKYLANMDWLTEIALGRLWSLTSWLAGTYLSFSPRSYSNKFKTENTSDEFISSTSIKRDSSVLGDGLESNSTITNQATQQVPSLLLPNMLSWHSTNEDLTAATFMIENQHTNELGLLHGGCQGMLMEKIGMEYFLKLQKNQENPSRQKTKSQNFDEFKNKKWQLKSMNVSYLSSAKQKSKIHILISEINFISIPSTASEVMCTMIIQLQKKRSNKNTKDDEIVIISEGILQWISFFSDNDKTMSKL